MWSNIHVSAHVIQRRNLSYNWCHYSLEQKSFIFYSIIWYLRNTSRVIEYLVENVIRESCDCSKCRHAGRTGLKMALLLRLRWHDKTGKANWQKLNTHNGTGDLAQDTQQEGDHDAGRRETQTLNTEERIRTKRKNLEITAGNQQVRPTWRTQDQRPSE